MLIKTTQIVTSLCSTSQSAAPAAHPRRDHELPLRRRRRRRQRFLHSGIPILACGKDHLDPERDWWAQTKGHWVFPIGYTWFGGRVGKKDLSAQDACQIHDRTGNAHKAPLLEKKVSVSPLNHSVSMKTPTWVVSFWIPLIKKLIVKKLKII